MNARTSTTFDPLVVRTRAMASEIVLTLWDPRRSRLELERSAERVVTMFHQVESECSRFLPSSALSRTNASPRRWHRVPEYLYLALVAAAEAHQDTGGVFDPRVLTSLQALGYDGQLRYSGAPGPVEPGRLHGFVAPWRPRFRHVRHDVWLGQPIDLGGIGKGLAVRWGAELLRGRVENFLIDAGGDCFALGHTPSDEPWRLGVEDPFEGPTPLAVLEVDAHAVATSSTRLRRWRVGNETVHHLIDPTTGRSGGAGLVAVTVVGEDTAIAEVESKVLFLAGRDAVAATARRRGVAALWCDDQGRVGRSDAMGPFVVWERP